MAPLGPSDSLKSRFGNEFCSTSGVPKPTSGFGFDVHPHMQRLVLSTASTSDDVAAFRIEQHAARNSYLQRRQQASQNDSSPPAAGSLCVGENADDMVTELPKQDAQFGQALHSFMQESMSGGTASSLMRYNSAPGSMLASLTGMGNAILNRDTELGQFLSSTDMHVELKKPMDRSHEPPHPIKSGGAAGPAVGARLDHLSNHTMGFLSSYGPYHRSFDHNNGEVLSQIAIDVDGAPLVQQHGGIQDAGRAVLDLPSSYHFKGGFSPDNGHLENGNGAVHGLDASKNGLLRHSSLPAGFLSQLNEEHEGHMLGSSSGNSSEEGSYERQGGQGYLGNLLWDEPGVGSPDASYAAKKRIRDMEEKGYSQKGDGLEQSVLGSYFGIPAATSPESAHFAEKLSPDAVFCRTRAKRGCATHPRSIAERVRRTKISERMKKLQELVPNMDKQTNTAEMLDEAVEYVKYLQRQVQELTESRSKCECSCSKQEGNSSK